MARARYVAFRHAYSTERRSARRHPDIWSDRSPRPLLVHSLGPGLSRRIGGERRVIAMTMSPTEIERKVRQVDNDVQSIYEMLAFIQGTQTRHSNRFEELAVKVDALDSKVGSLDHKVDALDSKVGSLDHKVDALDGKVGSLDGRVVTIDAKLDTVLELLGNAPPSAD